LGLRWTAVLYLAFMILLPLAAVLATGMELGPVALVSALASPVAASAIRLTLILAAVTTAVNTVMGTLTAWVLVRCEFPGRRLLNGLVDLPFAIPTLVTGLMLVVLYGPQGIAGTWLESMGIQVIFARPGIVLALSLVTYPFVVRSVQPGLMELERDQEEAAWTLGASRLTTFRRVVLPAILPAVITGSLLTFARAVGEFGSVVIVAGNIPGRTLTAPVHVYGLIESDQRQAAAAVSILLLAISFSLILVVDWLQRRKEARIASA
jgi:sulfate transport system permease protein